MNSPANTFKSTRTTGLKSFVLALCIAAAGSAFAVTTYTSKASGNWTAASTWTATGTGSPVKYIIKAGHTVTLNNYITSIDSLKIYGTLSFSLFYDLTMNNTGRIDVYLGGIINGGIIFNEIYFASASNSSTVSGPFNGADAIKGAVYATKSTSGFIGMPVPLPVELLSFNATAANHMVVLSWETASEINNDHFDIQRSSDGESWTSIGTVNGNGTSSNVNAYTFTDETPMFGNNMYRFVQVDYNGQGSESPVKSVMLLKASNRIGITAYPNPANNELNINIENDAYMNKESSVVTVVNNVGQQFDVTINETLGKISIGTQSLPEGLYSITVLSAGDTYSKNIIIKH